MKTTGSRKQSGLIAFRIIVVFCWGFMFLALLSGFVDVLRQLIYAHEAGISYVFTVVFLAVYGTIIAASLIIPVKLLIGAARAWRQLYLERKAVRMSNPYQYYKTMPNDFGIGVATLLTNSTIENEKDIVAALLDLCAQGYLQLSRHSDHYVIYLNPAPPARAPLSNESYLLKLIRGHSLANIDYQKWYQLCVDDGVNLGLFVRTRSLAASPSPTQPRPHRFNVQKIAAICMPIGFIFAAVAIPLCTAVLNNKILLAIASAITVIVVIIIPTTFAFIDFFSSMSHVAKKASEQNYRNILERHLKLTNKGVIELQKLLSFRDFLAEFSTFVDKDPEAVVLWDRYLAYAQVFGLTKNILKSGYAQLVENAAFRIDSIDNLNLRNIEVDSAKDVVKITTSSH